MPGEPERLTHVILLDKEPRAFIDIFTDISGLFVIDNESGWYEGWLMWDL